MKRMILAAVLATTPLFAQQTPAPEGAAVYFVNLSDGDTVSSPVTVVFGLSGMGVAPAGTEQENTGHHHLLVNREPFAADEADLSIPADENHIHFGGGQTEVTLELPAGEHTLQMVLGDATHVPHDPAIVSDYITIKVQ
ncbi:MAG: DUF4399 domain-containing protein [Pseudomonadota bacterium]